MVGKRPWRRGLAFLFVLGFLAAGVVSTPAAAQEMRFFRIGTGNVGGSYFPIGGLLGRVISSPLDSGPCEEGGNCGVPGLIGVAQSSAGSVANLGAISMGRLASGLAQADIVHWAYNGTQFYEGRGRASGLRVIANLFRESVHLVARRGSGIRTIADLVGKRVSLDTAGSGTQADALIILAAHDIDRASSAATLLESAKRYGIGVNAVEARLPMLLHGPVAAARLRHEMGIEDEDVLEAVRWHTTGVEPCGPIGRLIFIADKLDPDKAARYPHIDVVREQASRDLDRAAATFLAGDLTRLVGQGGLVHPASLEAYNSLILRLSET